MITEKATPKAEMVEQSKIGFKGSACAVRKTTREDEVQK